MEIRPALEPLTSAAVVFRDGDVGAMAHVVNLVSEFLDGATPARWSLQRACERGDLRLLRRVAARERPDATAGSIHRAFLAANGLVAAARIGDLDIVCWICCVYCPDVVPLKGIGEAASRGNLRVLQWLFNKYEALAPSDSVLYRAIAAGHLDVLQWAVVRARAPQNTIGRMLHYAAGRGNLGIVRWLHDAHYLVDGVALDPGAVYAQYALANAIEVGQFEIAQFLVGKGHRLGEKLRRHQHYGARSGNLEMVKWLHAQHLAQDSVGWIDEAAAAGHLNIVKWVHENNPRDVCSESAMDDAATNGHLDVVEWLHASRTEGCSTRAMDGAAKNGHREIVQWLHAHRCEGCTASAMDGAAGAGHLDIVRWLHEHRSEGCSVAAMNGAAGNGHLEIVQWLHANRTEGCTTVAMTDAARNGHLEVVQWLHDHRTEGCSTAAMDGAARNRHLHVVKWLHEHRTEGCTSDAMDYTNSLPVLQWLHEHRAEGCTHRAMEDAASMGNFAKLLFLKETNLGVCTNLAAIGACRSLHFEIVLWLSTNYPGDLDMDSVVQRCDRDYSVWANAFLRTQ